MTAMVVGVLYTEGRGMEWEVARQGEAGQGFGGKGCGNLRYAAVAAAGVCFCLFVLF